jgi:hypothetical protein
MRLPDDAAHRLLARAIELDHCRESETTLADLRAIAHEAGITTQAFDAALRELHAHGIASSATFHVSPVQREGLASRIWRRIAGRTEQPATLADAVVSNVIAATLFWVLTYILTRAASGLGWQGGELAILLGCTAGVGIARRLGARLVQVGLIGFVAFQAAELAMHLAFGLHSVQGGPTHFAVIGAGIIGAVIGWTANRTPGDRGMHSPVIPPSTSSATQNDGSARTSADGGLLLQRPRLASATPGFSP